MGISAAIFESAGKRTEHYIPGVYSRSQNVSSPSGVSAGNYVILGKSQGGKPYELMSFNSVSEAKDVLIGGDLLRALSYAFSPSSVYSPQKVYAMRVNEGKQATLKLKSGSNELLELTSWDYGSHTNQLKVWLQNGTKENSLKLDVTYKNDSYVTDNIIQESLSILYTGTGTNPIATIANGKLSLSATSGTDTVDNFEIVLDDYPTLSELATKINDLGVYVSSVLDANIDAESTKLDNVTAVSIADDTVFYSNFFALVKVLENNIYISDVNILTENYIVPDVSSVYEYFTGGENGNYTTEQWIKALAQLEVEDIQIISTPSTDQGVQTLIASHCELMSNETNRKERTCILGCSLNQSDEDSKEIAKGFNSKYVSYIPDSAIAINPLTGKKEEISGAILAVMLSSMESSIAINEPLTNKVIKVLGFTKKRTNTNIEDLLKNGLMVCNANPQNANEYICIRALTTFQGNDDLISCERSMVREDLYMNRDLRSKFAVGIGRPGEVSTSDVIQTLQDTAKTWATNGYIIPNNGQNVWNIHVKVVGDKCYLSFSRYLTAPLNFMFITATNRVYDSTIQL